MDLIDEAIDNFAAILTYFEDWKSSRMKSADSEFVETHDSRIFEGIMKRYVDISKKLIVDLYDLFDVYVVEKNRNPFIVKREGKKDKKLRFGRNKYKLDVETTPDDESPLFRDIFDSVAQEELLIFNKLYSGALKICRLLLFMRSIQGDPPAEKGEQRLTEMMTDSGMLVRGIVTFSQNASTDKEVEMFLDVTDSCKNLSGVEIYHIDDVTFGLKLILAKLKRMRHPYVSAIQDVEKVDEIFVGTPQNWVPKVFENNSKENEDTVDTGEILFDHDNDLISDHLKPQEGVHKLSPEAGGGDIGQAYSGQFYSQNQETASEVCHFREGDPAPYAGTSDSGKSPELATNHAHHKNSMGMEDENPLVCEHASGSPGLNEPEDICKPGTATLLPDQFERDVLEKIPTVETKSMKGVGKSRCTLQ